MFSKFKEFKVTLGDTIATVHTSKRSDDNYIILFNKEDHKDYVNGLKAFGFVSSTTRLGEEIIHFIPILLPHTNTLLTYEIMNSIWEEIKKEGLPD